MSSLKSRMAALKKGMGIGSTDMKGTKLPHTAAATDATSIQLRLALILHVSRLAVLDAAVRQVVSKRVKLSASYHK